MSVSSVRNTGKDKMSSPWFRMDQLLRCSVCSSRYRNPKLLPCNHTFCAEPCLERAVERGKGQVKCPECSAEHRIPIPGGVQGFPNNVTLARFLELRQQVTGREPDLPASMQKCNTCKEKGALETCAHCNRKICRECKAAHVNILRKEIALINSQVREGLKDLCTALRNTEENADKLQKNYAQVKDEIEEVVRRYTRDLLDTESKLKHHLDVYLKSELRSMRQLEHDLQIELNNVNSNCDLVDKYVNNGVDWTDAELTDYKEIFQRTLDFLRAFDSDPTDCVRKVRFHPRSDPDVVHKTLIDFAEVKLNDEVLCHPSSGSDVNGVDGPTVTLTPPQNSALTRSQSDHKLANLRQSQKRGESGRNQGEEVEPLSRRLRDRFARDRDRDSCERELSNSTREHSPSSWRKELDEARSNNSQRNRFSSRETIDELECYETDTVVPRKKPFRIPEDGRVSPNREHVSETEDATKGPLSGVIRILDSPHVMERLHNSEVRQKRQKEEEERRARMPPPAPPPVHRPMTRQMSEDEIEKQKRENKAAAAAATSSAKLSDSSRTKAATKKEDEPPLRSYATSKHTTSRDSSPPRTTRVRDDARHREDTQSPRPRPSWRTVTNDRDMSSSPPSSPTRNKDTQKPPVSPRTRDIPTPTRSASRSLLTKSSSLDHEDPPAENSSSQRRPYFSPTLSAGRSSPLTKNKEGERPRLRLTIPSQEIESESSSSSESESEEDSDAAANRGDISPSVNALLARSSQARRQSASTQARLLGRQDEPPSRPGSRSWRDSIQADSSRDTTRRRNPDPEEGTTSPYSRLLESRRRSSVTSSGRTRDVSPEKDSFAARRNRIARSKSSHDLIAAEDSPEDDTLSAIRNRYRTRNTTREKSPEEPPHSWSQYLKNKYGSAATRTSGTSGGLVRSRTSASLAIRKSDSENSSDDEATHRRRDYRRGDSSSPRGFSMPRRTYMQKGKAALKFGSRGTDHGHFTWPRGVCVGPDNTIVVADSNNHRVQVFNSSGKFIQEFGSYGSNEGEFDCLAAVTVNRIGQYIVSDRYNHRLQVFDPSGRFVRAFGSEGRTDGKFSYPWGVATDNLGFIYVCDKENHRIQIQIQCPIRLGMILPERKTILSGAGLAKNPEGVPGGRHLRHQVRGHRSAPGRAGAPPLRGRLLHKPGDRERLQQPPHPDLRREREAAVHLRHRGLRGGTVQVPEGGGRRRPGIPHRRRLREQQDTDLPPGRDFPAGVRDVGFRGRRVQRPGGHCRQLCGTDPRLRPGEPQDTGILTAKKNTRLRTWFCTAPKIRPFPLLSSVKLLSLQNL